MEHRVGEITSRARDDRPALNHGHRSVAELMQAMMEVASNRGVTSRQTGTEAGLHGVTAVPAAHAGTRGAWPRPGRTAAVGAVCGNTGLVDPGAGAGPTMEVAVTVVAPPRDEQVGRRADWFSMARPFPTISVIGLDVVAVEMLLAEPGVTCMLTGTSRGVRGEDPPSSLQMTFLVQVVRS